MARRYEVAVDSEFELRPRRSGWSLEDDPEPVDVWFQGRRFVWHPGNEKNCAIVTTVASHGDDFRAEAEAMERFLSALSRTHLWGLRLSAITPGHIVPRDEFDPPTWTQPRRPHYFHKVDPELVVTEEDDDLLMCLALLREGTNSRSPALALLSYFKVIEVVIGRSKSKLMKWVHKNCEVLREPWERNGFAAPTDWWDYFSKARNRAAHAIPKVGVSPLDPDDAELRDAIASDASKIHMLAVRAVHERWDPPVLENDPSTELLGQNVPYR